jgi:hypothetical protein
VKCKLHTFWSEDLEGRCLGVLGVHKRIILKRILENCVKDAVYGTELTQDWIQRLDSLTPVMHIWFHKIREFLEQLNN